MSAAEQEIADLDASLEKDGQTIVLRRLTGAAQIPFSCDCMAFVRGYAPEELVSGITQQDSRVIMSPTQIIAKGWPGPAVTPAPMPSNADRRVPIKGDKAVIAGRLRNIEAAVGIYLEDALIRIEMRVLG